jgi:hypothetical protein
MDLGLISVGISILGSIVTSAVMIGSMRATIHHINLTLGDLSRQQNEHLQFHLKSGGK